MDLVDKLLYEQYSGDNLLEDYGFGNASHSICPRKPSRSYSNIYQDDSIRRLSPPIESLFGPYDFQKDLEATSGFTARTGSEVRSESRDTGSRPQRDSATSGTLTTTISMSGKEPSVVQNGPFYLLTDPVEDAGGKPQLTGFTDLISKNKLEKFYRKYCVKKSFKPNLASFLPNIAGPIDDMPNCATLSSLVAAPPVASKEIRPFKGEQLHGFELFPNNIRVTPTFEAISSGNRIPQNSSQNSHLDPIKNLNSNTFLNSETRINSISNFKNNSLDNFKNNSLNNSLNFNRAERNSSLCSKQSNFSDFNKVKKKRKKEKKKKREKLRDVSYSVAS